MVGRRTYFVVACAAQLGRACAQLGCACASMAGYSNLIELLLADDYSVVAALHVVADVCEVEPLAKALLLIFSAEGKELQAAARLVKQEFALHQHEQVLQACLIL